MKHPCAVLALVLLLLPWWVPAQQPGGAISREQAIRIVEQTLKEECTAPIECRFSPSRIEGGWSVLVWFCRRNATGSCDYVLGGSDNKFVFVRDDGTIKLITGT